LWSRAVPLQVKNALRMFASEQAGSAFQVLTTFEQTSTVVKYNLQVSQTQKATGIRPWPCLP